jgi:uncharacterized protein with PQ loop repeat
VLTTAIGTAAGVVTTLQVARQVYDVYQVERPAGVSWMTWQLALIQSIGLFVLSIDRDYVLPGIVNGCVGVLTAAVLGKLLGTTRSAALVIVSAVALMLVYVEVNGATAGTVGAVASGFVWIPQAIRSFRRRSGLGLSWPFIAAGLASSVLWGVYAVLIGEWRLLVPPVAAIASLIVTWSYSLAASDTEPRTP